MLLQVHKCYVFAEKYWEPFKNKYTNEKREIIDRLTLLFQHFCRKDVWLDTELKMPVCNTSLLGLICGALPCIIDKQLMCQRLVREMPIKHHFNIDHIFKNFIVKTRS